MFEVEFFSLRWETALLRYYLLMALPILGGFSGQWWIGLFALPVFLSVVTGMKITRKVDKKTTSTLKKPKKGRVVSMTKEQETKSA